MRDISVTVSSPEVVLDGDTGAVTASVTNGGATTERVVLQAFPAGASGSEAAGPADAGWATVERPLREIGAGATEQYAVTLAAPSAQTGTYRLKLVAHPAAAAPEEYADRGQVLRVVVPATQEAPAQPPPSRRRWWPWLLGAVLLGAVLLVLFLLLRPGGDPRAEIPDVSPPAEEGGAGGADEETAAPGPDPAPVISEGQLTFTPTMALDLDSGAVNPSSGADVVWRQPALDELVTEPVNEARLASLRATSLESVTLEQLEALSYRSDPITTREVGGTVLAVVTDEGRHAVLGLDPAGIAFDLRWVTFE